MGPLEAKAQAWREKSSEERVSRYVELTKALAEVGDSGVDEEWDEIADEMDPIWLALSDEEHETVRERLKKGC